MESAFDATALAEQTCSCFPTQVMMIFIAVRRGMEKGEWRKQRSADWEWKAERRGEFRIGDLELVTGESRVDGRAGMRELGLESGGVRVTRDLE